MSELQIEISLRSTAASLEMKGFTVDEKAKIWYKKLLNNETTTEDYISLVKENTVLNVYYHNYRLNR